MAIIKMSDLEFSRIWSYDPFNSRARKDGSVISWVARTPNGESIAYGDTKKECMQEARWYISVHCK